MTVGSSQLPFVHCVSQQSCTSLDHGSSLLQTLPNGMPALPPAPQGVAVLAPPQAKQAAPVVPAILADLMPHLMLGLPQSQPQPLSQSLPSFVNPVAPSFHAKVTFLASATWLLPCMKGFLFGAMSAHSRSLHLHPPNAPEEQYSWSSYSDYGCVHRGSTNHPHRMGEGTLRTMLMKPPPAQAIMRPRPGHCPKLRLRLMFPFRFGRCCSSRSRSPDRSGAHPP